MSQIPLTAFLIKIRLVNHFTNRLPRFQFFYKTSNLCKSFIRLNNSLLARDKITPRFEEQIALYFKSPFCLTTSSFRMGWYFSLKALRLNENDEILMTPITIPDTVNAALILKLKPVFVEMSCIDHCVDITSLKKYLTPKSKVLLVTYLSGIVPDMEKIQLFAKNNNLILVEDFSQNYEAHYNGKYMGTFGDISIGSLSSGKILSATVGGIILTKSQSYAEAIKKEIEYFSQAPSKKVLSYYLKNCLSVEFATLRPVYIFLTHNILKILSLFKKDGIVDFEHDPDHENNIFFTSKPKLRTSFPASFYTWLCDWQAAMALDLLESMKLNTDKRRRLAEILCTRLDPAALKLVPLNLQNFSQNSYYHFPINCNGQKKELRKFLFNQGIDNGSYGLNLCSEEEVFKHLAVDLINARSIKNDTLFLPLNERYSEAHMHHIADSLNQFVKLFS
jgi:perosamine synthetase